MFLPTSTTRSDELYINEINISHDQVNDSDIDYAPSSHCAPMLLYALILQNFLDSYSLLSIGADPNAKDNYGIPIIFHLIALDNVKAIKFLINESQSLDFKSTLSGKIPVVFKNIAKSFDLKLKSAKFLLSEELQQHTEDLHITFSNKTHLEFANIINMSTHQKHTEEIIKILENPAMYKSNSSNYEIISNHNAKDEKNEYEIDPTKQHCIPNLLIALLYKDYERAERLISLGASVDDKDILGTPIILYLIHVGHLEAIKFLITKDVNLNFTYLGLTPVQYALDMKLRQEDREDIENADEIMHLLDHFRELQRSKDYDHNINQDEQHTINHHKTTAIEIKISDKDYDAMQENIQSSEYISYISFYKSNTSNIRLNLINESLQYNTHGVISFSEIIVPDNSNVSDDIDESYEFDVNDYDYSHLRL